MTLLGCRAHSAVYEMCRPVLVRKNADGIYIGRAQYVHKRDETEKQKTVLYE